jgi:hypothetical protein
VVCCLPGSAAGAVEPVAGPRKVVPRSALDLSAGAEADDSDAVKTPLSVLLDDEEALVRFERV